MVVGRRALRDVLGVGVLVGLAPLQNLLVGGIVQVPGGVAGARTLAERVEYMRGCWTGGGKFGSMGKLGGVDGALGVDLDGGKRGGGRTGGGVRGNGILLEASIDGGVRGPGMRLGGGDGLRPEHGAGVSRARSLRAGVDDRRVDVIGVAEERRLDVRRCRRITLWLSCSASALKL